MLLTKEQARARLESPNNLTNKVVRNNSHFELRTLTHGGREEGTKNLTEQERLTIASIAQLDKAENVAREFGISRQHVENLKFGRVDSRRYADKEHPELKNKLRIVKDEIKDKALQVLMGSLGLLDDEKMSDLDGKDLSVVASNMSKVVNNLEPKEQHDNGTKILIYAPQMKEVEEFKVVEV